MLTKGSVVLLALACVMLFAGASWGVPVSSVVSLPLHSMPSRTPSSIVRSMAFTPDPDDPVFGDVYPAAIFWLFIDVGNPSRSFPVAIDSGSYTLDIPSVGCSGCPTSQPNNQYDGSKSTTAKKMRCGFSCDGCSNGQCTFSNTYETCDLSNPTAPCTIAGNYFQDQVKVAGLGPVNVTFGAITTQTTNFDQFKIIDGVVGMAGPGGSSNVFQSLVDAKFLAHSIWSLCLVHGSKSNGTITLGGIDSRLVSGPIQYVPNLDGSDGMYTFKMKDIQVGGSSVLGGKTYKAILDTGTNVLLVPTPIFNSIKSSMQANCTQSNLNGVCNSGKTLFDGACFTFTDDQINAFPTLTLVLDGVKLSMAPSTYILPKDGDVTNTYCLGIRPTGQNGFLIVGDTTIEPYLVVFDRENARIGWGAVNKDNCGSV